MASATDQQPWTIKRLLDWTTEFFHSKELDSPRLCAEILLADALKCQRIELYTRFDQIPDEPALGFFRDWVKRHAKGEPVAYLVGHKEFYSLKFQVDSNVLIPRPETEHLVLAAIEAAKTVGKEKVSIIDIGTGSGCVAITLVKQISNCAMTATDICANALGVAQKNAATFGLENLINFVISDLFDSVPDDFQPDIIVSNPPYIGNRERDEIDESVKNFEPECALFAGDDGTAVISRLVKQASDRLTSGGFLIFETSPIIFDRCLEFVNECRTFNEPKVIKDYSGHRRILEAIKK